MLADFGVKHAKSPCNANECEHSILSKCMALSRTRCSAAAIGTAPFWSLSTGDVRRRGTARMSDLRIVRLVSVCCLGVYWRRIGANLVRAVTRPGS